MASAPLDDVEYKRILQRLKTSPNDKDRLRLVGNQFNAYSLSNHQVFEILETFQFSDTKVSAAVKLYALLPSDVASRFTDEVVAKFKWPEEKEDIKKALNLV